VTEPGAWSQLIFVSVAARIEMAARSADAPQARFFFGVRSQLSRVAERLVLDAEHKHTPPCSPHDPPQGRLRVQA